MGKKTIYQCDCCGMECTDGEFNDGVKSGKSMFTLNGTVGIKGYDGAWGGGSHSYKELLCVTCTQKMIVFYEDLIKKNKLPNSGLTEDLVVFGDQWVYCNQHLRPHKTGWCSVSPKNKVALGVKNEKEAFEKCEAWNFKIGNLQQE